jgi:hypothetical protein
VMCCSLWFPFFVFGLKSIFSTVLPNFYLWKQGLSDVLLFCDSFLLCLVLRVFSTVLPISTHESRDWVMCCSLWFSCVWSYECFFNSPTQFLPMKAGSDVLFCDFLCLVLRVFSTVLPNSYLWSRDWVMCW